MSEEDPEINDSFITFTITSRNVEAVKAAGLSHLKYSLDFPLQ